MMNSKITKQAASKRSQLALVLVTSLSIMYAPLSTALVFTEVSTEELSEMRGKFLSRNNKVSYFGLTMRTHWKRSGHDMHSAMAKLQIKSTSSGYKTSYSHSTQGEEQADAEPLAGANPALTQIGGAVQSIQVAGSNNTVENSVALDVVAADPGANVVDNVASIDAPPAVAAPEPVTTTYVTDNGIATQFTRGEVLGLTIESEGSTVVQSIGANPITSTSQLLQAVNLIGTNHQILNDIQLQVGFDNSRRIRQSVRMGSLIGLR